MLPPTPLPDLQESPGASSLSALGRSQLWRTGTRAAMGQACNLQGTGSTRSVRARLGLRRRTAYRQYAGSCLQVLMMGQVCRLWWRIEFSWACSVSGRLSLMGRPRSLVGRRGVRRKGMHSLNVQGCVGYSLLTKLLCSIFRHVQHKLMLH